TERPGRLSALLGETDAGQGRGDAVATVGGQLTKERRPGAAALGQSELQILEDGQVLEHCRPLELAPDPEIGDRSLVETAEIRPARKENLARIRSGLPGDDIHHRRLPCSVRADDR